MNKNQGRHNLITRFICSECGSQLCLSYKDARRINEQDDGITGAFKYESYVSIEPCSICKNKYEEPLRQMKAALKQVQDIADTRRT